MKKYPWSSRFRIITALFFSICILMLNACGASSKSSTTGAYSETYAAAATTAAYDSEAGYGYGENAEMSSGQEAPEQTHSDSGNSNGAGDITATGRKLIRQVDLSVETQTFDEFISQLGERIAQLGGYIEQSEISGNSIWSGDRAPSKYASVTARIPSSKLDAFVTAVKSNSNVTRQSEQTEDVTLRYSDIESRKKSLEIEQERMWVLLEKADTLESVITLEQRLSEIRYELESYESQLRLYDNQVEYSIVNLSVMEVTASDQTPIEPESMGTQIQKGFAKTLGRVTGAIRALFIGIVTTSPIWFLPLLVCLCALLIYRKKGLPKKKDIKEQENITNTHK